MGMDTDSKLVRRTKNGPVWNKLSIPRGNPTEEKVGTLLGDLGTPHL